MKISRPKTLIIALGATTSLLSLIGFVYYQQQQTSIRSKAATPMQVTREGKYLIDHRHEGDLRTGKSTFDTFLETDTGEKIKLQFQSKTPPNIVPNSRIKVKGTNTGRNTLQVDPASLPPSARDAQTILEKTGGNNIQIIKESQRNVLAATAKVVRLAVVLINYTDFQSQPYDKDQIIQEAITNADSLEKYIEENAYGSIDLQIDVLGYYTVGSFTCSPTYEMAASKANQAGVNLGNYQQIILTAPTDSRCSFNGGISDMSRVAMILFKEGFTQPNKWRSYAMHELSHNFGAQHSGNLSCTSSGQRVAISGSCTADTNNRLDPFGIMGMSNNQLNIYNRLEMDYITASQFPTVSSNGTYTIEPLETPSSGVKGIKVAGSNRSYFLEFRQPYGVFDNFAPTDPVVNGISIRTFGGGLFGGGGLVLLDNTANTNPSDPNGLGSFMDSSLTAGNFFYDAAQRISIETLSVAPSGASVRITFNSDPPTASSPTPIPPTPTFTPTTTPTQTPPTPTMTSAPTQIPPTSTPTLTPIPPQTTPAQPAPTFVCGGSIFNICSPTPTPYPTSAPTKGISQPSPTLTPSPSMDTVPPSIIPKQNLTEPCPTTPLGFFQQLINFIQTLFGGKKTC